MPELLKKTLEMKKLAMKANGIMKKVTLKTTRMREIADGKKRIPETDPEYREIDELKESAEVLLGQLEKVAGKYSEASAEFTSVTQENDLYLANAEELRVQMEASEVELIAAVKRARADLRKYKVKAKTKGQKRIYSEMNDVVIEIADEGRAILKLIKLLVNRLDDDEVAIGPHSDPNVTVKRIREAMGKITVLEDEYKELAEAF